MNVKMVKTMKLNAFNNLKQSLIEEGKIDTIEFGNCVQEDTVFVRDGVYALSSKKIESLLRIAEMQKYYQCNPVRFIKDFFNIELLDAQAWIIQAAWTCPNVLLVCSRG